MTEKVRKFFEESEEVGRRVEPAPMGEHPVVMEMPSASGGEAPPAPGPDETEGEE